MTGDVVLDRDGITAGLILLRRARVDASVTAAPAREAVAALCAAVAPLLASALTRMDHRVGQAAQGWGRPQRWPFSLRTRARSRRWASRTCGSRALALRQRR